MMYYITVLSLVSSIFLAALMLVYKLWLARECQPRLNRFILVGSLFVSMAALPLTAVFHKPSAAQTGTIEILQPHAVALEGDNTREVNFGREILAVLPGLVLGAGIVAMMFHWGKANRKIMSVIRRGEQEPIGDYSLVIVEDEGIAPFSFMQKIVMSRKDFETNGQMIVTHELAHIRARHWVDLLIARAVLCFQWYNPAAWLLLSELRAVHEYEADAYVIEKGFDRKNYQYLLIEKAAGIRFQSLANSLNHSKLKNRIAMMYNQKSSLAGRLRALALLPALAAAMAITQIPAVASMIENANSALVFSSAKTESASVSAGASIATSASADKVSEKTSDGKVIAAPEVMPEFPGGMKALLQYLASNIHYPESAMKANVQGRVVLRFEVKTDGSIGDITVLKSVSPELDAEAIRVTRAMPRWTPGTVDGVPVNCYYALPVQFSLKGNGPAKSDAPVAVGEDNEGDIRVVAFSPDGENSSKETPAYFVDGKLFTGDLNEITVSDIESMTVVKDDPDYPQGKINIVMKK